MDTDELSQEAYTAIIIEAEKFNHDLTLQFGALASSCKNEKEYLLKAKNLIKEIQQLFKENIILESGELDRKKIASIVFQHPELLKQLKDPILQNWI